MGCPSLPFTGGYSQRGSRNYTCAFSSCEQRPPRKAERESRIVTTYHNAAGDPQREGGYPQGYYTRAFNVCVQRPPWEAERPPSALYHRWYADTKLCHLYRCRRVLLAYAMPVMCCVRFTVSRKCISISPRIRKVLPCLSKPPYRAEKYATLIFHRHAILYIIYLYLPQS